MTTPPALRVGAEGVSGRVVPAPSTPGPRTAGGGSRPSLPLATGASREEVIAFGGIPDPVSEGRRMSSRLLDHPEVDDMQQRCAKRTAKLRGIEATTGYLPSYGVDPFMVITHSDGGQGAFGYWVYPVGDGCSGYLQPVWMAVM
ncbi:hypothetical protein ACQJBY_072173 [Aegilops geniculata]